MTGAAAINPDGYVHARTDEEYRRLRSQALMWERATLRVFDRVGLRSGATCLDVGCGPGEVMRLMGTRVGPEGHVVGIDVDGKIGREALAELRLAGPSRYNFVEGNVVTLDEPVGAPFDLCFIRMALMHMSDPVAVLGRMRRWARPGGTVAAQEYDFGAFAPEPRFPEWDEFERVFLGVFEAHDRSLHIGRQLPALFREAGLGEPDDTYSVARFAPLSQFKAMLASVYNGLVPAALAAGLTDEKRARDFRTGLDRAADKGAYCISPLLIAAWTQVH